jgi:hypothetical protein
LNARHRLRTAIGRTMPADLYMMRFLSLGSGLGPASGASWAMANHRPKGEEYMRELALASAAARHKKRAAEIAGILPVPAELLSRPNLSGGSPDNDWPCPYCRRVNSIQRRSCGECRKSPANGRMTMAARRKREKEYRTRAILAKFGL